MTRIPLSQPYVNAAEKRAVSEVLNSGWLTQGPKTIEFEKAFARYTGSHYACAVSNCTNALFLSLLAVGVKPGDRVLTVSHSFIATANAIRHCGAEPIFLDVRASDLGMDADLLETFLKKNNPKRLKISAILPVHQIGFPCEIQKIVKIAQKYRLPVVEDAACAIGSELNGQKIGKPHGDVACFSFHPRKILTTGDGGMITTNNKKIDAFVRLRRVHGMNVPSEKRHSGKKLIVEKYLVTGYNFRLTDIQSAIGLAQLQKMPRIMRLRRQLAKIYIKKLRPISWLRPFVQPKSSNPNWQSFAVEILPDAPLSIRALLNHLIQKGIHTKPGIINAHEEAPYRGHREKLPVSEYLRRNTLLLPFYIGLKDSEVDFIVHTLAHAHKT